MPIPLYPAHRASCDVCLSASGIVLVRIVLSNERPTVKDRLHSVYGSGRITQPRRVIAEIADQMDGAFTVEMLADRVRQRESMAGSTATVYRAVAAMESAGYIERVGARESSALYARCGTNTHHHHIVCDGCGRVAQTACPVLSQVASGEPDGFVITRHEVTFYGLCPACASEGGR